jgi:hypothetical protein
VGAVKWVLVFFAVTAMGLVFVSKVITFFNPPRPGVEPPRALKRVQRSLRWTIVGAVLVGIAILVLAVSQ